MRVAIFAAVLAALAAPALAQDARIRSGEHDTFSRLVVYMPATADYELERAEGAFAINFGADFGFDASQVFSRIPRTRIAALTGADGRLELDLACDCVVTVERLSGSAVYLDVNDPGTVPEPESERAAPEIAVAPAAPRLRSPTIRMPAFAEDATATLLPGGLGLPRLGPIAPRKESAGEGGTVQRNAVQPEGAPVAPPLIPDTSSAVAEQIARAAAQGLLDVKPVDFPVARPERRPQQAGPAAPSEAAAQPPPSGTKRHVSIRSSVDAALGRNVAEALSDLGLTGTCLPDEAFDVADWLPEGAAGLGRLRSRVVGEFDRADPQGVAALARAYVAMSFGAEARHVVRTFRVTVPDADVLLAMADIVDNGSAREPGRLATQYDCPGAGTLWAALSASKIPDAAELDTDAVALAFSALPPHLRRRLGPMLAERLLAYGATESASVVRTAILRAPGDPTVETALLEASIALKAGREQEADAKLAEVVEETSGRSVEAVERLIERRLKAGEPVEDEVLAAADALIYEHRGTPVAYRLSELRIEGLATSGKARRALSLLGETERHLPRETADRLRGVAYREAARLLDGADFLLVAVTAAEELGHSPEEMAARRALARRLGEMKLYALAESLGVEEGRAAPGRSTPLPAARTASAIREPLPDATATLERTSALLDHSAALRQRLAALLDGEEAQ